MIPRIDYVIRRLVKAFQNDKKVEHGGALTRPETWCQHTRVKAENAEGGEVIERVEIFVAAPACIVVCPNNLLAEQHYETAMHFISALNEKMQDSPEFQSEHLLPPKIGCAKVIGNVKLHDQYRA